MDWMASREHIKFIADSENRLALLTELSRGPTRARDLQALYNLSRPTIWRNLNEFIARNWVQEDAGSYQLTTVGRLILSQYTSFSQIIKCIDEQASFFEQLGPTCETFPVTGLEEATIVTSTPESPDIAINYVVEKLTDQTLESLRLLTPHPRGIFNTVYQQSLIVTIQAEAIICETEYDLLKSYLPEFTVAISTPECLTVHVHPEMPDFGIVLSDHRTMIGAYDDWGYLRTLLDTMDTAVFEWAMNIYETWRQGATTITDLLQ